MDIGSLSQYQNRCSAALAPKADEIAYCLLRAGCSGYRMLFFCDERSTVTLIITFWVLTSLELSAEHLPQVNFKLCRDRVGKRGHD